MSNEELHIDGDFTLNIPHFEADFTENEQPKMQADFKIQTGGSTSFANITGSPYDNEALSDALNQKADTSTVETLSETVENNYTELDGKITDESDARTQADADLQSNIDDVTDDLSIETDNRQTADADLQDNIDTVDGKIDTHIADKSNPHEVTKAQIGLGNVDNTSDLNKPISTATQTALNGKQNTINDLATIRTNASNGQSAYNTIQNYGDIVTYDASYFATSVQGQKADTALQPNDNISELNNDAGYITSASLPTVNNSTITFQKNNVTVGDINLNQPNNETINISVPTQASDVNALPDTTTINDLTTTAQQNAIDSGANTSNIGQIATNTQNITNEVTNRQNADNNLQSQIDAIVASSDVFDIVGTYADLQAYDISTVPVNDIIKVLVDSTHSNAATYYRCVETGGVKSWSYIGSEGAYYTKSESDSLFVDKTTTVNGKALSSNITLTASDVGALPSSTVIGNGTLTIQNNSVDVDTFSANATSNKTINIVTPTKTSDLTNDSGFIDSSALSGLATQTDLTNGLATKQDTISDLSTIRSNAANGQSAYTTIGGYGDIVTHNTSEFATSAQGDLADTSIQPNDNITLLNNNAGFISGIDSTDVITALGYTPYNSTNPNNYTSNVGTVTSVNNTQPDADGDVTLTMPTVNDGVLTITQNGTSKGTFSANQSTNDTIALTDTTYNNFTGADGTNAGSSGLVPAPSATDNDKYLKGDGTWASVSGGSSTDVQINGTSITSNNVANILTESAYSSSNKIATMSDLPADKIFIATYGTTTYNEIKTAIQNGKIVVCKPNSITYNLTYVTSTVYAFTYFKPDTCYIVEVTNGNLWSSGSYTYQQTSTAVTHTANTQVGSSSTPVYIASNGTATSTGLSIASSRFDGQWTWKYQAVENNAKAVGSYSYALSNYLPDTTNKYEIFVRTRAEYDSALSVYGIGTVASPADNMSLSGQYFFQTYVQANSRVAASSFILPFNANGTLYYQVKSAKLAGLAIHLCGYRRIGTNT